MIDVEEEFVKIIQLLEAAKNGIEMLRVAKLEEKIDGRCLSISITHIETGQLWLANGRK